jgi:hypothetical protein
MAGSSDRQRSPRRARDRSPNDSLRAGRRQCLLQRPDEGRRRDGGAGQSLSVEEAADEAVEHYFEDRHGGRWLGGADPIRRTVDAGSNVRMDAILKAYLAL